MRMSVVTRPSAPWHSHTQPSSTAGASIHMASLLSLKQARPFHKHAVGGGAGFAQPLLPSSATAAFTDCCEGEDEGVRGGFASDLALPSSVALPLFGYSAAQWPFTPQLKLWSKLGCAEREVPSQTSDG